MRGSFRPFLEYVIRQLEHSSVHAHADETWMDHSERLSRLSLKDLEYTVTDPFVLNAADFGVAQTRERAFIVAVCKGLPRFEPPAATHSRASLVKAQEDGSYWSTHNMDRPDDWAPPRRHSRTSEDRALLRWRTVRDAVGGLGEPADNEDGAVANHWAIGGARSYHGHSGSIYDWPSKTIKAGVHGVPGGENMLALPDGTVRYFTLREAASLQSFPSNHLFEGRRSSVTKQIGNAVPCLLAEAVATSIAKVLPSEGVSCEY